MPWATSAVRRRREDRISQARSVREPDNTGVRSFGGDPSDRRVGCSGPQEVSPVPLSYPRRVAMISMHTSPLATPGVGDAGGLNVYVAELARRLGERGLKVDVFTRAGRT